MPFNYRLQKILELREQKLEVKKQEFAEKKQEVDKIQEEIQKNTSEQINIKNILAGGVKEELSPEIYTNRLKYLQNTREILDDKLLEAQTQLAAAQAEMLKAQQEVEVLIKHKDKSQKQKGQPDTEVG